MLQTKLQGLLKFPLFPLISFSCSKNKSRVPEVPEVGHQVFLVSASSYWFLGLVFHSLEMLEKKYFIAHRCVPNVTLVWTCVFVQFSVIILPSSLLFLPLGWFVLCTIILPFPEFQINAISQLLNLTFIIYHTSFWIHSCCCLVIQGRVFTSYTFYFII